ncbi:DUF2974 domain-containing protein [Thermoactinomyces sp. DSM 45892]|uniref:DUF2974 domain-containing protein n=1 Tax=Thermoactinomyces sp. DSM 45892 TaxID=1882753 RepID=UPI00089D48C2|nr:DUF2974 domain-containing protein [Thermoactinomyces sp. DSM 45892]SDY04501.1 Protein of unknown function [Thermoactinomyces sp. DSM 45892]
MRNITKYGKSLLIQLVFLLGFMLLGQSIAVAEGIDQTPINGEFNTEIAGTSTVKEKGFLEEAGDWLSDKWDFVWEGAKDIAAGIWQEICDVFNFIASFVIEIIGFVVIGMGVLLTWGIFKGEKNAFTDMFQRVGEYLVGIDRNNPHGKLSDVKATDKQLAYAADMVYKDNITKKNLEKLGEGWELGPQIDSMNGLQAKTFVNEETKEIIISFRGTEGLGDYFSDAILAAGLDSYVPQSGAAIQFVEQLLNNPDFKGYRFALTGHSLGGYIANEAGMTYRIPTVAFNAPGKNLYPNINASLATGYAGGAGTYAINMSDYRNRRQAYNEAAGNFDGLIRNYNSYEDVVGSVGYRPGETYVIDRKGEVTHKKGLDNNIAKGIESSINNGVIENHAMSNFTGEVDGKPVSTPIASIYKKNNGNIVPRK